MKKIFTYIFTLAACLRITGCSSAGGISTFTRAVEKMPTNFDPQIATSKEDLLVITNIFDGLFEIQDGQVVNNLAESCEISPDGKNYTIKIKEDNVFSCRGDKKKDYDGRGVTAKDFEFALARVMDAKTHSPYRESFKNIRSISTQGDYILQIRLHNPDFNFSEKLAMTAAYPCNEEFFYATGGAYGLTLDNILSNGPFRLNYIDSDGGNATIIRVVENSSAVQRIRIKQVDPLTQTTIYENDEISGFFAPASRKMKFENTRQITFDSGNISLMFNLNNSLFTNEKIRQAIGWYAYGFVNSGANMAAVNSTGSIFPDTITMAGHQLNKVVTPVTPAYLSADARQLFQTGLAEMGVIKPNSAKVLMPNDTVYTVIYDNINQKWQKNLNRFFTVEYLPASEIKARIAKGSYDLAFLPLTPQSNTPYDLLDIFSPFSSEAAALTESAKAMADREKALPYISQAQNLLLEKAMVVPMGSEQTIFYYKNYFHNITVDPFTNVINLKKATV